MIPLIPLDALAALVSLATAFVAGVAFAAYRAVGWVDRMRAWAYSTAEPVQLLGGPTCGGCAGPTSTSTTTEGKTR